MNHFLIDTNILIFKFAEDNLLSDSVLSIFENQNNKIYVSAISIFELLHLSANKRIQLDIYTDTDLTSLLKNVGIEVLHTNSECFSVFGNLPTIHNDPLDRIIIAQAIAYKLSLISSDGKFTEYAKSTPLKFIENKKKSIVKTSKTKVNIKN